jgi:GDP-4-dehydro-6-deoxy-D-mannose reductase
MKNVLITGADGFLGSHLTDFLVKKNFHVYALKRPEGELRNLTHYTNGKKNFDINEKRILFNKRIHLPTKEKNVSIVECDIKDGELLDTIICETKPKFIYHFAAQPYVIPSWEDPINTIEINVIGTLNLFEPIKRERLKTRVMVACSSAEYGTTTQINRPLKEEDKLKAIHPYGISKIATELLARQYFLNFGIEIINLRFFNQTGPRKENDACADFISQVAKIELGLKDPEIEVGNLEPYRDILGVKDSMQAIWLTTKKGKPGETYNVCSNRKTKIRDLLKIALSFSSKSIEVKENTPKRLRKTDEDIIIGDNSKIKKNLGFRVTQSIEEILKDMFNYWIEQYQK